MRGTARLEQKCLKHIKLEQKTPWTRTIAEAWTSDVWTEIFWSFEHKTARVAGPWSEKTEAIEAQARAERARKTD